MVNVLEVGLIGKDKDKELAEPGSPESTEASHAGAHSQDPQGTFQTLITRVQVTSSLASSSLNDKSLALQLYENSGKGS
jgi:hypothetical protein